MQCDDCASPAGGGSLASDAPHVSNQTAMPAGKKRKKATYYSWKSGHLYLIIIEALSKGLSKDETLVLFKNKLGITLEKDNVSTRCTMVNNVAKQVHMCAMLEYDVRYNSNYPELAKLAPAELVRLNDMKVRMIMEELGLDAASHPTVVDDLAEIGKRLAAANTARIAKKAAKHSPATDRSLDGDAVDGDDQEDEDGENDNEGKKSNAPVRVTDKKHRMLAPSEAQSDSSSDDGRRTASAAQSLPPVPPPPVPASGNKPVAPTAQSSLEEKLAKFTESMEANFAKLTGAMEQLVQVMVAKHSS